MSLCSKCNILWTTEDAQSVSVPGQWEGECKFGAPFSGAPCKERALNGQWHALVSLEVFSIVLLLCSKTTKQLYGLIQNKN